MIIPLLERLLRWLDRRQGCFALDGPVVVPHGESWLRIAPDQEPRWYEDDGVRAWLT